MPVMDHRLKRRVESVRRSLRRIEPLDRVELPVRQVNAPLRVRFQTAHLALVTQVLDRRGHGGVGLGEIRQHGGIHGIQIPAGNRAVVHQLAVPRNRDAVARDRHQRRRGVRRRLNDERLALHGRAERRVGQHGGIVRQPPHRVAGGQIHHDDAAARRGRGIRDVREARRAARQVKTHVVDRSALRDQTVREHDGPLDRVGRQVDGHELGSAGDERRARAEVAHVQHPQRVAGIHVHALRGQEMRRRLGGVQRVDLLVRVSDRIAVDDFRHGFLDGIDAVARERHEHPARRRHGHTDHLLLELRHHLQVTDVKINRPVGGHGRDVFNLVFVVLACER